MEQSKLALLKNIILPFSNNALNGLSILVYLSLLTYIRNKLRERKLNLNNKIAFITGGSEGSGLAVAKLFLKQGGKGVTIIARNMQKLEKAQKELESSRLNKDQKIVIFSADVTCYEQQKNALEYSNQQHGDTPDYYFMVAGFATPGYFLEQDLNTHKKHMDINYFGCLYTSRLATESLISNKKKGKLVFFSSATAVCGMIGYSQYTPSKYALRGLTDCLRQELLPHGIDVYLYIPSNIDSPGHVIENQTKPIETQEIEGTAQTFSCEAVADCLFKGIARRQYTISNEFLVEIGRISTDGPVPTGNLFFDLLMMPIAPLVRFFFNLFAEYVIQKHHKKKQVEKKQQ